MPNARSCFNDAQANLSAHVNAAKHTGGCKANGLPRCCLTFWNQKRGVCNKLFKTKPANHQSWEAWIVNFSGAQYVCVSARANASQIDHGTSNEPSMSDCLSSKSVQTTVTLLCARADSCYSHPCPLNQAMTAVTATLRQLQPPCYNPCAGKPDYIHRSS